MSVRASQIAVYTGIVDTHVDTDGNLSLRRRRFMERQDVFHPAGEWETVEMAPEGGCVVKLKEPVG